MIDFKLGKPPIKPGDWLREDMLRGGLTQSELATMCGVSRFRINEILNGKRSLTAESAVLIGEALNVGAEGLMTLQVRYDLYEARRKIVAERNAAEMDRLRLLAYSPKGRRQAAGGWGA